MKYLWLLMIVAIGCSPSKESKDDIDKLPVVTDLLGNEHLIPEWTASQKAKLDSNVLVAKQNFEADPSEENYIWYGRREAYRYHLTKAIEIYTEGISKFPESYRLYRHRGHRYISLRQFDKAIEDLTKASQLMEGQSIDTEPDGIPNKLDQPLSSTQFNVWYHLGLAHYLKGDFEKAKVAYFNCLSVSGNDDLMVATLDWLYMTYQREGRKPAADSLLLLISEPMEIIENDSYFTRIKMYQGQLAPDSVLNPNPSSDDYDLALATQGYGVGNWYLYHGDTAKAKTIFNQIVKGKQYSAFGFIAAETELAWLEDCKEGKPAWPFCREKLAAMKSNKVF
jgi:Tetratricopeptide repeat.